MSSILYYSNYCENSKKLLQKIGVSSIKDDMHFICLDKRVKKSNGATYVVLENGQELLLPPSITKVPALLLLNRGHHVLFGDEIDKYIEPQEIAKQQVSVGEMGEPAAYALNGGGGVTEFGVSSDNYSYLDQDMEELLAKGGGGMRQAHHYAGIEHSDKIETPPEDYEPDKIGAVNMDDLQNQRNNDVSQKRL